MSYSINQNNMPLNQQKLAMGFTTPQGQNVNAGDVAGSMTQKSVLKGVASDSGENKWIKPVLTLPIGLAIIKGMDKFNSACSNANGKKDIITKISEFGDMIALKVPHAEKAVNKIGEYWVKLDTLASNHSRIWSALFHAPTKPECSMAKGALGGLKSSIGSDAISKLKDYIEQGGKIQGTTIAELDALSKNSHTDAALKRISEICKNQGLNASIEIKDFWNLKNIPIIGNKLFKKDVFLTEKFHILRKLEHKIYLSEYVNKINAFVAPKGKTLLGKKLPNLCMRVLEGLTQGGAAGSKVFAFLGAFFVADAFKKAFDAKKGEKVSTLAENINYNIGFFATMPLAGAIMYKIGGLQHIGMGKGKEAVAKNVEAYNKAVEEFNAKALAKEFTKDEYNKAFYAIRDMFKGDTKLSRSNSFFKNVRNLFVDKPLKFLGNLQSVGLGALRPFIKKSDNAFVKFMKNIPYKIKRGTGYPVRFALFMMVISPFLAKFFAKGSHVIFGKPSKSVLDDYADHSNDGKLPPIVYPTQQTAEAIATAQKIEQQQDALRPANVQSQQAFVNNQASKDMFQPSAKNNMISTGTTSSPVQRRYIPSSEAVNLNSNEAEEKAKKVLNSSYKAENNVNLALG